MRKVVVWLSSIVFFFLFLLGIGMGSPMFFFPVQAQSASVDLNSPVSSSLVGPHEAGNLPNIGDKVSGLPIVVILRAGGSYEQFLSTVLRYSSASQMVIRVTGVNDETTTADAAAVANTINQLSSVVPAGTIVVYGNELNNLQVEWRNPSISVAQAGSRYAPLFSAFHTALNKEHFDSAPSPLDVHNTDYNWEEFYDAAASAYSQAEVLVANAYHFDEANSAAASLATFESKAGRQVSFLTEFGYNPGGTLEENVRFLRENDPPRSLPAATLIPNKCGGREFNTDGSTEDPWLYYVRGEVFNVAGEKVTIGSGNTCGGSTTYSTLDPVLIYPQIEKDSTLAQISPDLTLEDTMWRRYLSNTQVYCAPDQIFYPTNANTSNGGNLTNCIPAGDVGPGGTDGDNICEADEFPIVDVESETNITSLSFPLFRDDGGGISIEADLSRVDSSDTFFEAAQRNSRPEYAPQFYLTSPETQCLNAVRFANYVEKACENWFEPTPDGVASGTENEGRCGANIDVTLPDGTTVPILDLQDEILNSESVCVDYAAEADDLDSRLSQAVRSVQPHTPRVYKMGFVVQHIFNYDPNLPLERQFSQNTSLAQRIINWFSGANEGSVGSLSEAAGEKVDIVPIWYHVGMAASMYDEYQTEQPYAINPDNPAATEFGAGETQQFTGALLQTYLPVLQPAHQDFISNTIRNYVYGNNDLMRFMAEHFQSTGSQRGASRENVYFQNSDVAAVTGNPLGWTPNAYDAAVRSDEYHQFPLPCLGGEACFCFDTGSGEQCFNQSYEDVEEGFPETFQPSQSYLDAMRRQIVYRINAGVQATHQYPQNIIDEDADQYWVDGSVSMRHFGGTQALCEVDQENVRQGYQEEVSDIESSAQQSGQNPITQLITEIRSKVLGWAGTDSIDRTATFPGGPTTADMRKERVERVYLVLPDDAIKIGVAQNTLLQTFLPPETYVSLIRGEHEMLPIRERMEAEGVELSGATAMLSAHLRVNGLIRNVRAESEGYVRVAPVQYENLGDTCGARLTDVATLNRDGLPWVPSDPDPEQTPDPTNNCVGLQIIEESLVGVRGEQQGENPDERPEAPGQLFALNEYVRRMAFTPLHMQPYEEYPGLEEYYRGGANARSATDAIARMQGQTPAACVYQPREVDVLAEYGYSSDLTDPDEDPFKEEICQVEAESGVSGDYLRSIMEIEASPFLRAVRGAGSGTYNPSPTSFICGANRAGAVGIMNLIVGECSSQANTQGFSNAPNSLSPDLCTVSGSMSAAANLIRAHQPLVREVVQPTSSNMYTYYELLAERYLGIGSCGDIGVRDDGTEAYRGGPDYCAYVAERATGKFRNYCE